MAITKEERVSLENLAQGAAIERFNDELQRVMNNVVDPNTADGIREICLKVQIKPNPERTMGSVKVICSSKTMPARACETIFYCGSERGKGVAFEHDPRQMQMELDKSKTPIVAIAGGKAVDA